MRKMSEQQNDNFISNIFFFYRYIYVRFNLGSHTASMRSRKKITIGNWHFLYLRREAKDAIMQLDSNYFIGVRGFRFYDNA